MGSAWLCKAMLFPLHESPRSPGVESPSGSGSIKIQGDIGGHRVPSCIICGRRGALGILLVTLQTLSCFLDCNEDRQAGQPIFPGNIYISCKIFPVCAGCGSGLLFILATRQKKGSGSWHLVGMDTGFEDRWTWIQIPAPSLESWATG